MPLRQKSVSGHDQTSMEYRPCGLAQEELQVVEVAALQKCSVQ
jgi:hypothetical protein